MIRRIALPAVLVALSAACAPTPPSSPSPSASATAPAPSASVSTAPSASPAAQAGPVRILEDGAEMMLLDKTVTQENAPAPVLSKVWRQYTLGRGRGPSDAGKLTPGEVYVELTLEGSDFSAPGWTMDKFKKGYFLYRRATSKDALLTWERVELSNPPAAGMTIDLKQVGSNLEAHIVAPVRKGTSGEKDITVDITATLPNADI